MTTGETDFERQLIAKAKEMLDIIREEGARQSKRAERASQTFRLMLVCEQTGATVGTVAEGITAVTPDGFNQHAGGHYLDCQDIPERARAVVAKYKRGDVANG